MSAGELTYNCLEVDVLTRKGLSLSIVVLTLTLDCSPFLSWSLPPYSNDTESIDPWRDEGNGTLSGGTYMSMNTDIANMVNATHTDMVKRAIVSPSQLLQYLQ